MGGLGIGPGKDLALSGFVVDAGGVGFNGGGAGEEDGGRELVNVDGATVGGFGGEGGARGNGGGQEVGGEVGQTREG